MKGKIPESIFIPIVKKNGTLSVVKDTHGKARIYTTYENVFKNVANENFDGIVKYKIEKFF